MGLLCLEIAFPCKLSIAIWAPFGSMYCKYNKHNTSETHNMMIVSSEYYNGSNKVNFKTDHVDNVFPAWNGHQTQYFSILCEHHSHVFNCLVERNILHEQLH